MRLGLIARADSRGLGIQTRGYHDNLHPIKTMVVDCPSVKPLPIRRDWYQRPTWIKGLPTPQDCERWLQGLSVILTAETFYGTHMSQIARRMGVKTVLACNYEFLNVADQPTLWAAPTRWRFNDIPSPKVHLPVPVETHRFTPQTADRATNFLHIVGRPAEVPDTRGVIHERAGTLDLLKALQLIHTHITVTITCQQRGYVQNLINTHHIKVPDNVNLRLMDGDTPNYWDLYTGHHVLISPRRFGGLSLPMQEASAAAMPVIAPNVSPNNDWLPKDWLISATKTGQCMVKTLIDIYSVDHTALAAKIAQFANNPTYYRQASEQAAAIGKQLSWDELRPLYEQALS